MAVGLSEAADMMWEDGIAERQRYMCGSAPGSSMARLATWGAP